MTNRPAGLFKRIIAAFIDFVCVFFVCYAVTFAFTSSKLYEDMFNIEEKYVAMNEVVCPSLVDKGLGYYTNDEGKPMTCTTYTGDEYIANHIDNFKANNPGKTEEEIIDLIYDQYDTLAEQHDKMIDKNDIYQENYDALVNIETGIFYVTTFVGEIIFLLVVPMVNKNNKTLGKYLLRLKLITTKDLEISKNQVLINFVCLYGIETVLYSLFLGIDSLIVFTPLISLMVILFSPRKQNIHHMLSRTVIVEEQGAVVFSSLEEKAKYDATLKR